MSGVEAWELWCSESLRFFGRITASVTHELKNHLSVIQEQTGLISDLIVLSSRGIPLDTERVEGLVQTITRRIGQADDTIKRLNGFSHSADVPSREIDLREMVQSIIGISHRLASQKGVEIKSIPTESPLLIETNLFLLYQLLFLCLEQTLENLVQGETIEISLYEDKNLLLCAMASSGKRQAVFEKVQTVLSMPWFELLGVQITPLDALAGVRLQIPRKAPNYE